MCILIPCCLDVNKSLAVTSKASVNLQRQGISIRGIPGPFCMHSCGLMPMMCLHGNNGCHP